MNSWHNKVLVGQESSSRTKAIIDDFFTLASCFSHRRQGRLFEHKSRWCLHRCWLPQSGESFALSLFSPISSLNQLAWWKIPHVSITGKWFDTLEPTRGIVLPPAPPLPPLPLQFTCRIGFSNFKFSSPLGSRFTFSLDWIGIRCEIKAEIQKSRPLWLKTLAVAEPRYQICLKICFQIWWRLNLQIESIRVSAIFWNWAFSVEPTSINYRLEFLIDAFDWSDSESRFTVNPRWGEWVPATWRWTIRLLNLMVTRFQQPTDFNRF